MPEKDFTGVMRKIDALQERIDSVFKRVNADPIYETERAIADAISDNPRYFSEDRKKELAEIFFAVLDQVYDRIVKQDKTNPFCNPLLPVSEGGKPRLPEFEMTARILMPLGWALEAKWAAPELSCVLDSYTAIFKEDEAALVYDLLVFLLDLFPEFRDCPHGRDVLEYWRRFALERESMHPETDADKSFLLSVLVRKKAELDAARKK